MKKPHKDKPTTQGDLDTVVAVMLKGFERIENKMATKDDLKRLATKDDLNRLEKKVDTLETTVNKIEGNVVDIKRRVTNLEIDTAPRSQVAGYKRRIEKLETHVFAS